MIIANNNFFLNYLTLINILFIEMGIGDWGLGIWGLGLGPKTPTPNPQPTTPNPKPPKIL